MLLVGVIHLPPLPGSPRAGSIEQALERAASDAKTLADAGFDVMLIENFNDAPFHAEKVPPVTIAAMTACALEAKRAAPEMKLAINVLRNDAEAAVSIAHVTGAQFVRINVHTHARLTDQGIVTGRAADTLRLRAALDARVAIWADVAVKHSAPIAELPIEEEARDLALRGMADAIIVTGSGTGENVDLDRLDRVRKSVSIPIFVGSGATEGTLRDLLARASGIIVGSALRADGKAGGPIDAGKASSFALRCRASSA